MELEKRLINWGRCQRDRARWSHCASIEHRWRSPQCWDPSEPKPDNDLLDAFLVEKAWVRMMNPKSKQVLRLMYVKRWQPMQIMWRVKERGDFQNVLTIAHGGIGIELDRLEKESVKTRTPSRYKLFHSTTTRSNALSALREGPV